MTAIIRSIDSFIKILPGVIDFFRATPDVTAVIDDFSLYVVTKLVSWFSITSYFLLKAGTCRT
jgi:hypothetical protein